MAMKRKAKRGQLEGSKVLDCSRACNCKELSRCGTEL